VTGVTALGVSGELLAVAEPERTIAVPVLATLLKGSLKTICSVDVPVFAILVMQYERYN